MRIRGARPKLACVKVSPVDAAREAGHPQMAWTLVARCSGGRPLPRSRADVAGWRGRWQCTATRHSLPAVRVAHLPAACAPQAAARRTPA